MADVTTVLHAVELDLANHFVGPLLRLAYIVGQCGDTQHPSTSGQQLICLAHRTGVEHGQVRPGSGYSPDTVAAARLLWIPLYVQDHANRRTPAPSSSRLAS